MILKETDITSSTDTTADSETSQATVVERHVGKDQAEGGQSDSGGMLNKVVIVKEYNSDDNGSPDKPPTPPKDYTGHMVSVSAITPKAVIDSSLEGHNRSLMKKISKQLVDKSAEVAEVPDTEQKKKQGSEVD